MVDIDVRTHIEPFKEELTWALDKRLCVISTIMLFVGLYVGGSKRKSVPYVP